MKNLSILFFVIMTLSSCQRLQTTQATEVISISEFKNEADYKKIPKGADWADYDGKKVQLSVRLCDFEMQHMIKTSMDEAEGHVCVDIISEKQDNIGQILTYTPNYEAIIKKYKGKTFNIYGILGSISGAGKGGGTHTEYYLQLDYAK